MTALALKARIYLYAASPLVNCQRADDPGLLVSYGSYSKERWQLAYDAAKKFMDMNNAQAGAETGIWYELRQGVIDNTTPTKSWWPKFYHAFMDDLVSSKESIFCDFMKMKLVLVKIVLSWMAFCTEFTRNPLLGFEPIDRVPYTGAG